jgi:beta-galactosidase
MLKKAFTHILLLSTIFISAQTKQEVYMFSYFVGNGEDGLHLAYSYDGLKWDALNNNESFLKPTVGKDKLMRDPFILKGIDGTFHMVWTTGWKDSYIGYASSKDLITWSDQKLIPVMDHEPDVQNSWAPEMFYDEVTGTYHIFWASSILGKHSPVGQLPDAINPKNHRMYYVTTKDFNSFSETKMFFNPDFSVIDTSIIKDDDRFIMFLKNENPNPAEKNIRVTISNKSVLDFPVKVSKPITGNYWAEGPAPLKIGDYFYVYFDKYKEHKYGAVRSKDLKKWEDISDQVKFPTGIRHGAAFTVSNELFQKLKAYKKFQH